MVLWPTSPSQIWGGGGVYERNGEREGYTWFILPLVNQPLCFSSPPPPPFMGHMVSHSRKKILGNWPGNVICAFPACCTEYLQYNCVSTQTGITLSLHYPALSKISDQDVLLCRHDDDDRNTRKASDQKIHHHYTAQFLVLGHHVQWCPQEEFLWHTADVLIKSFCLTMTCQSLTASDRWSPEAIGICISQQSRQSVGTF